MGLRAKGARTLSGGPDRSATALGPPASAFRHQIGRRVPAIGWVRGYDRRQLGPDLLAGCVVAALAIPQALGYAAIAGVPVELGLYAVPLALIAYAIFGTSRQLVVGPVSTVSVMSGSLVAALHPADVSQAVLFTTAAALWAGIVLIVAAQLRIGWVAEFLSKPIVTGFVLGLTLLVILGELPRLLGITVRESDVLGRIKALATGWAQFDPLTLLVSASALIVLFVGAWLAPRIPWSLVVLVAGLVASAAFDLAARGVAIVGAVPAGLSGFGLPIVPANRLIDVAFAGAALAFVGLAEGLSAARLFAVKGGYRLETDQELFAAGAANLASGLAGGLAVAGSLSKTAAVDRAGGKSRWPVLRPRPSPAGDLVLRPDAVRPAHGGAERDRRPCRLGSDRHPGYPAIPRVSPDRPRCCVRGGRRGARGRPAARSAAGGGDVDSRSGVPIKPGDHRRDGQGAGGEGRLGSDGEPRGEDHPARAYSSCG